MAVTTTTRIVGPFLGNGTATTFPFAFKVFTAADLYLLREDPSGNIAILVLGADYSAALNSNQDVYPGGSVTLTAGALALGYRLTVTSAVQELQQVILTNLGGFFPDVLNTVFDRLTILIQQVRGELNRTLKFSLLDDAGSTELPSAIQRAGKFLYFGADGSVSLVSAAPFAAAAMFSGTLIGTQDGNNTVFALANGLAPIGVTPLDVTVSKNFPLIPGDANGYTLGPMPGQVTFAVAPLPTDSLFAKGAFSVSSGSTSSQSGGGGSSVVPFAVNPYGFIDGTNVTYTLPVTPLFLVLALNGSVLTPGTSYAISGNTITMATAPSVGDMLYAQGF